ETANRNATGIMEQLPDKVPAFAEPLLLRYRALERETWRSFMRSQVMTRGFDGENWCDWRRVFFYRFVDPESRAGPGLNYAERLRGANALLLTDSAQAIYYSRREARRTAAGVNLMIMRLSR